MDRDAYLLPSPEPGKKRRKKTKLPPFSRLWHVGNGMGKIVYAPWKALRMYGAIQPDEVCAIPVGCIEDVHTGESDEVLRRVLEVLRKTRFPQQYRRRVHSDTAVEGMVLGKAHVFDKRCSTGGRPKIYKDTIATTTHSELWAAVVELMRALAPHALFTSVQVNRCNYDCALHVDRRNVGPSYIIALGGFCTGGELQILRYRVDIHNKLLCFNGQLPHRALPHGGGDRYSLVFFNAGDCDDGGIDTRSNCDLAAVCTDPETLRLRRYCTDSA